MHTSYIYLIIKGENTKGTWISSREPEQRHASLRRQTLPGPCSWCRAHPPWTWRWRHRRACAAQRRPCSLPSCHHHGRPGHRHRGHPSASFHLSRPCLRHRLYHHQTPGHRRPHDRRHRTCLPSRRVRLQDLTEEQVLVRLRQCTETRMGLWLVTSSRWPHGAEPTKSL